MWTVDTTWNSLTTAYPPNGVWTYNASNATWSQSEYHWFVKCDIIDWHLAGSALCAPRYQKKCTPSHNKSIFLVLIFSAPRLAARALFRFTQSHAIDFPVCYGLPSVMETHRSINGNVYMLWRSVTNWLMKSIFGIDMFHACKSVSFYHVPACPLIFVRSRFFFQFFEMLHWNCGKTNILFIFIYLFMLFPFLRYAIFFLSLEYILFSAVMSHAQHAFDFFPVQFEWREKYTNNRSFQMTFHQLWCIECVCHLFRYTNAM